MADNSLQTSTDLQRLVADIAQGGAVLHMDRRYRDSIANGDRNFNTITAIDVLQFVDDDLAALREIFAALPDGGQLIVTVPALPFLLGRVDRARGCLRRYSCDQLVQLVNEAGFLVRGTRYFNAVGFLPFLLGRNLLGLGGRADRQPGLEKSWLHRAAEKVMRGWFRRVENRFNFGFGLTLICTAEKPITGCHGQRPRVSRAKVVRARKAA